MHFRNYRIPPLVFILLIPAVSWEKPHPPFGEALLTSAKELIGVPFQETPVTTSGQLHPTEAHQATNCAGLVTYALRKQGIYLRYASAKGLRHQLREKGWELKSVAAFKPGDILLFGNQTALLVRDTIPLGHLNDNDELLYAHYAPVKISSWADLPFQKHSFEIFRPR